MYILEKKGKRQEEIFKISNLTFHVKKLEKKEIIRIRAETSKTDNRKLRQKNQQNQKLVL